MEFRERAFAKQANIIFLSIISSRKEKSIACLHELRAGIDLHSACTALPTIITLKCVATVRDWPSSLCETRRSGGWGFKPTLLSMCAGLEESRPQEKAKPVSNGLDLFFVQILPRPSRTQRNTA